ncbi:hypothetical protein NA78x_002541 [Anatilimnocola sp. NA78]|uniref:hypothetical protein n=1 Tax=Anatilimnocola sp. NA78 TaxID=3415683 RepID=UPI003CE54428
MQSDDVPKPAGLLSASWLQLVKAKLQREADKENILVAKLNDDSGVIVVFPIEKNGFSNAQIINSTGTVRCQLEIPYEFRNGHGFWDAYYVQGELTAILLTPGRDFAFVIDEQTGCVLRSYETR